jgi:hypothetical protein
MHHFLSLLKWLYVTPVNYKVIKEARFHFRQISLYKENNYSITFYRKLSVRR